MRISNPMLNDKTFGDYGLHRRNYTADHDSAETLTVIGTAQKTLFLLVLAVGTACFTWSKVFTGVQANPVAAMLWAFGGGMAAFITAVAIGFKSTWAPTLAPVYALAKGLFLGGVSAGLETRFPGIVVQAFGATFGTLAGLLLTYQSGLIKPTANLKLGVVAASSGICLVYLVSFVGVLLGFPIPYLHDAGPIGIGFSLFVVVIAALNLVLDFDFIEQAAERGVPKYLEWYGAFALMVALVWLFMAMLRLMSKVRGKH